MTEPPSGSSLLPGRVRALTQTLERPDTLAERVEASVADAAAGALASAPPAALRPHHRPVGRDPGSGGGGHRRPGRAGRDRRRLRRAGLPVGPRRDGVRRLRLRDLLPVLQLGGIGVCVQRRRARPDLRLRLGLDPAARLRVVRRRRLRQHGRHRPDPVGLVRRPFGWVCFALAGFALTMVFAYRSIRLSTIVIFVCEGVAVLLLDHRRGRRPAQGWLSPSRPLVAARSSCTASRSACSDSAS